MAHDPIYGGGIEKSLLGEKGLQRLRADRAPVGSIVGVPVIVLAAHPSTGSR